MITPFERRPYYGAALVEESSTRSGAKQQSTATTVDFHPRPSIHSDLPANEPNSLRHFCISLVTCICLWRPPVWDTCNLAFSERACDLRHQVRSSPFAVSTRTPRLIRAMHWNARPSTNRSCAVRLSFCRHHFGQCLRATYAIVRALLLFCGKGKTAGKELEEAWQPLMILPTYGQTKIAPLTSD